MSKKKYGLPDLFEKEDGQITIIVALIITTLIAVTALVVDLGTAYIQTSHAQNAADAVALSAGKQLPIPETNTVGVEALKNTAIEYAKKNGFDITPDDIQLTLQNGLYNKLTVRIHTVAETKLAAVIGISHINVSRSASVSLSPAGRITGAVPIGITEETFQNAIDTGQTQHLTLKYGGGDGVNGFFGFVVLDKSNGNANILLNWMQYGYPGENYVGELLPTATGNKVSAADQGFTYRYQHCTHFLGMGGCNINHYVEDCPRIVKVLVYYQNNRDEVEVKGFAPFILESTSNDGEVVGSYVKMQMPPLGQESTKDCGSYNIHLS